MAAKRTGLGRGIGALIPTTESTSERPVDVFFPGASATGTAVKERPAAKRAAAEDVETTDTAETSEAVDELLAVPGARLVSVNPNDIVPNPRQPRSIFDPDDLAELVHSVKEFGVLQPVVVRQNADGEYELIMGERRTRAAREAGLEAIPAILRETSDDDMLRDALLENLHRSELNPLEEASAYQQLLDDFGITQEELATRIGRSRPQISNTIRLLRLPVPVQQRVAAGVLSAGHARAVLSLDDEEAMQKLADRIVNEDLSVRAAEAAAKAKNDVGTRRVPPKAGARQAYLDEVADRLGDRLNTKVRVALGARKGQISIDFASIQDLNRILEDLGETGYGA
ncbi:ParB/RepB/Spo0J family partition protein [Microbacterium horticulturae]|uniref:ParB/RepB/Spo0J family partition protein n=1 Tax=Microbacterium horticulturae TaxID=3028316 RepID=A0ABY8C0U9_9MICO|nr:ParB/RepB/Spo0J family partition protein [Microbacterium sp. KACC 23027]WEG08962.1 ParB/RepB/Spo0J family partition protein [Microbacterium sp. KACC 23027]